MDLVTRHDNPAEIPPLRWPEIQRVQFSYTGNIDGLEIDSLLVLFQENRPASSLDVDGELWVRYDPESGEVIGIEIDDFERFFLGKYPVLGHEWPLLKEKSQWGAWLTGPLAVGYAGFLQSIALRGIDQWAGWETDSLRWPLPQYRKKGPT